MSIAMNTSADLREKDEKYLWHAMKGHPSETAAPALTVESAKGAWIKDIDGNEYLDGMSGLWCVNAGYGRTSIAEAVYEQLKKMPYFPLAHSHPPAIELAEKLNEYLDDDYVIFFSNSGSEANETAFKIVRQYHAQKGEGERYKFISRYRGYHGGTMGALAATGQFQRKHNYGPSPAGFLHVPPPDVYRNPADEESLVSAEMIDQVMTWEVDQSIAGVIIEPIITGGGILMPPQNYLKRVKEICEKHGALLIVDEVICGFGRTGEMFGFKDYEVKPDIITMAKGITSAYMPLSATAVRRDIYETYIGDEDFGRLRHVNTYGGSPGACMAALENIRILEEENLCDRSKEAGDWLLRELKSLENHQHVGDVRGKGLLVGIELVEDKTVKSPLASELSQKVVSECKNRGLIVGRNSDTVAGYDNIIQLSPPLVVTDEDLNFISNTLKEVIENVL